MLACVVEKVCDPMKIVVDCMLINELRIMKLRYGSIWATEMLVKTQAHLL